MQYSQQKNYNTAGGSWRVQSERTCFLNALGVIHGLFTDGWFLYIQLEYVVMLELLYTKVHGLMTEEKFLQRNKLMLTE